MSGGARRAAVLGSPIRHSLSPLLHRAAYAALGLDGWEYDGIECHAGELAALVAAAGPEFAGFSCTMPLKREVLDVADRVSEVAQAIGAGNTLIRTSRGWDADNTDWVGVAEALSEAGVPATGSVAVLGAGGTAQAALAALERAQSVTVLVRDPARSLELQATADRLGRSVAVASIGQVDVLSAVDLVINTLPGDGADQFAGLRWRPSQNLLDVVYDPWPTRLAASVRQAGGRVVSGASMLLFQAARQVELMTGHAAPVQAMRAALAAASPGALREPTPSSPSPRDSAAS